MQVLNLIHHDLKKSWIEVVESCKKPGLTWLFTQIFHTDAEHTANHNLCRQDNKWAAAVT